MSSFTKVTDCPCPSTRLGLKRGAWTSEEDLLLKQCIETYGEGNWQNVPLRAGLSRCRKSCRLRWLNYLKPGIKRNDFDVYEIDLILRLHRLLGNRWALIAGRIPGRTANDIKNYWNSHLSKRVDPKTSIIIDHRGMKFGNNLKRKNAGNLNMAVEKQEKMKRSTVKKTKIMAKMVENGAASIVLEANNYDETTAVNSQPLTITPNFQIPKVTTSPCRENSKTSFCQMVQKSGNVTLLDPNPRNENSSCNNANSKTSPSNAKEGNISHPKTSTSNAKEGNISHPNSDNEDSWWMSPLFRREDASADGGDISFPISPPLIMDDDHVQTMGNGQLELQNLDLDDDILWKFMSDRCM